MALTIATETSATSNSSTSTLALTVTAAVGTMLLLVASSDNAGVAGAASLSATVTDSSGNTWVNRALSNYSPTATTSDATTQGIWTCLVGTALTAGTVTLNYSPNTTVKTAAIKKITPAAGEIITVVGVGTPVTGTGTVFAANTVSVASGDTIFGVVSLESTTSGSDTDTTNGTWVAALAAQINGGSTPLSQSVSTQHKTVNATGNQTFDITVAAGSRDGVINYIVIGPRTITASMAGASTVSGALTGIGSTVFTAAGSSTVAGVLNGAGNTVFTAAGSSTVTAVLNGSRTAFFRARGNSTFNAVFDGTLRDPGDARSLRILVQFDWVIDTTARLWDGGGPWVDGAGNVWIGAGSFGSLDEIEQAINGEAATVNLTLSGVGSEGSGLVWLSYRNEQIIGSVVTILIQQCDANDQPIGLPEIRFTGTIDDISFSDKVTDSRPVSTIEVPVVNKFTVRRLTSGSVLSDGDQKARSAILNPGAAPDLFCERVTGLQDKTVVWPRWN